MQYTHLLLAYICLMLSLVEANDKGMIGIFTAPCSRGWEQYKPLSGRTPLAQGNYTKTMADKTEKVLIYLPLEKGGSRLLYVTPEMLANHTHWNQPYNLGVKSDPSCMKAATTDSCPIVSVDTKTAYNITTTFSSEPINIMSPYLVVYFCIRTTELVTSNATELWVELVLSFVFSVLITLVNCFRAFSKDQ